MENYYVLTKTRPGDLYITLRPISDTNQMRIIKLTSQMPSTRLPKDWALGVFLDAKVFTFYQKGYFSFGDKTDEIVKAAVDAGVYFGDKEIKDNSNRQNEVLKVLKEGKRTEIIAFIKKDPELVALVTRANIGELTTNVVGLVEDQLGIQLTIDGE
jgi:hypothetical protein